MVFIRLIPLSATKAGDFAVRSRKGIWVCTGLAVVSTYERQSTVGTHVYLWLVCVDEDPRMAQWASTTIARNHLVMRPAHGLLMYQLDRGVWLWLQQLSSAMTSKPIPAADLPMD